MGLRTKFNVIMVFAYLVGIGGIGWVSFEILQRNAREEILHIAGLIMENAMAVRGYTSEEIRPLLSDDAGHDFLPQTVPAYAASRSIEKFRANYPEYTYKEATLNPTNPIDRATDWERAIIDHFRNNPDENELVGVRQTALGPSMYMARPIEVDSPGCLSCHGKIQAAPEAMRERYGEANGFGWQMNEIVGSQVVNVPMSVALDRAQGAFWAFMITSSGYFLIVMLVANILLHYVVIKPVKRISDTAHEISMGRMEVPEWQPRGKDEIASLAESFNRMRRSLINAIKLLDE